ncbi:hypothetical protein [Flavobacterium sp. CAU 1735]|uniref:hypothetical protein n=1 Tax=Flavobacterium sp. CAU 1735 TaxID=3140361 RepID=UPI003260093E
MSNNSIQTAIKRVSDLKDDNPIEIVSENPEFQPFQLHKKKINTIAITIVAILLT